MLVPKMLIVSPMLVALGKKSLYDGLGKVEPFGPEPEAGGLPLPAPEKSVCFWHEQMLMHSIAMLHAARPDAEKRYLAKRNGME